MTLSLNLFKLNLIGSPALFELRVDEWLNTMIFKCPSSRIEFVVFAVQDLPLLNQVIIHARVIVVPVLNCLFLVLLVVQFGCKAVLFHLWTWCILLGIASLVLDNSIEVCRITSTKTSCLFLSKVLYERNILESLR